MMVAAAAVAVTIGLVMEFGDGLPPRTVIRRVPARLHQLRPGMTRKQAHEILRLRESWLTGGLGATYGEGVLANRTMTETYDLRPHERYNRYATPKHPFPAISSLRWRPTAAIRLQFDADLQACGGFTSCEAFQVPPPGNPRVTPGYPWVVWDQRQEDSARLVGAWFVGHHKVMAEMPGSPKVER
jgi:hypothetical protein